MTEGQKRAGVLLAVLALGALAGVWFGYHQWFKPPPIDQNPVSQFNGLLQSWELRTLPRPSSVVEPGALLSGRLKWLVSRKKAWSNADAMVQGTTPVLTSATYIDTRDASGRWRTVLPALGPLNEAEASLGLTGAQTVETRVEGVDVIEVAESDLSPDLLTTEARRHLSNSVVVVREICRIKKLTYRFTDKNGKTIGAKADVAKATVEGDLSRVDTSGGELVLENVCIAFGQCDILYVPGEGSDSAFTMEYVRTIDPNRKTVKITGDVVKLTAKPEHATEVATFVETQGRLFEFNKRMKDTPDVLMPGKMKVDVEHWARVNREGFVLPVHRVELGPSR